MAEAQFRGRKLDELKVMEIKEELGRRGLNKKGLKAVLMKRLESALLMEKQDEEDVAVDVLSVDSTSNDCENAGVANDVLPSTDSEKLAESEDGDDESAPSQKIACERCEGDVMKEQPMEGVEEAPIVDGESDEEVTETSKGQNLTAVDTDSSDDHRIGSFSSSMELAHLHEEELIYEGDEEDEVVKDVEESVDTKGDDTGEEVIFDLSQEVDIQLDTTDNEQKTSFSGNKLADENSKEKEEGNTNGKSASAEASRCSNLWVSGLVVSVSAADLKTLFSPFGQVISAKVVARARSKSHRYGYVTMASPEQAEKSIKALHNTELKGWKISIELAKTANPMALAESKQQENDKDTAAGEGDGVTILQELKDEEYTSRKSETRVGDPGKGGSDNDARAKTTTSKSSTTNESSAVTPVTTTSSNKDSSSKVENKKDPLTSASSTSGRRIIMVDKGDGKKELVRVGSTYGKARDPPPKIQRRSFSPPRHVVRGFGLPGRGMIMSRLSPPRGRGDMRHDIIQREMEHRSVHSRLGGRFMDERALEMQLHEERQRMYYEREREREHLWREVEMDQHRKQQQFVRQMQEVHAREAQRRSIFEQQRREAIERERIFHQREQEIREKERLLQERELREKERLEALEKQKEREYRERERRFREQLQREMKEKEMNLLKERELREQKIRLQEKELQESQNRLREEQERQAKLKEQERQEQERQRRIQEEEARKERERHREQERREQERSTAKRPFPGEHSTDIPTKRQAFSSRPDSHAANTQFGRGWQAGITRDNHQSLSYGSERAGGRSVISPYAHNQNKLKEGMSAYSRNPQMQEQSGAGGFAYGSRAPSSPFRKLSSPGYGSPHDGAKGHASFGTLTPELISVASQALSQIVTGGNLDHTKEPARGGNRGGHPRLPYPGQRSMSGNFSGEDMSSEMVSYPSVFGQSRAMPQPNLPRGGFYAARAPGYRNPPGDSWYDRGVHPSVRGGGYRRM